MFNKEPTVVINGLSGLLQQILPLLVVIGVVHLSPEKLAGLISIIGLVLAFVTTTLLRSQVMSNEHAKELADLTNQQIKQGIKGPSDATVAEVKAIVEETNVELS